MQSQTESFVTRIYTDSELDLSQPHRYSLNVWIASGQLGFMLYQGDRVYGMRTIEPQTDLFHASSAQLMQLVKELEWYTPDLKQVTVFIDHQSYTLVPEALFSAQQAASYLGMVHPVSNKDVVLANRIADHAAMCVFSVPQSLHTLIKIIFPSAEIAHQLQSLLAISKHTSDRSFRDTLIVQIHGDFMDVLYYYNSEIKYLNTFKTEADTDMVYFMLSVCEQLKLNSEKFAVVLMGNISNTSAAVGLMKKYIPEVRFAERLEGIHFPVSFREMQSQEQYTLIHSLLCEL